MASWREIDSIRKNAVQFRALAARLLKLTNEGFTEWELEFLEGKARDTTTAEFTVRQAESLLDIRDSTILYDTWRGFSIRKLIQGCFEVRLDLSEDDEDWIDALHSAMPNAVKRRNIGRLMRLSAQLDLIENQDAA